MQWDDSAAAEAFNNAKMRYWGYCNGFPCSIPLPNPDAYIDEIDWISIGSNAPELEKIDNKKDTNKFKRKKYDGFGVNKVDKIITGRTMMVLEEIKWIIRGRNMMMAFGTTHQDIGPRDFTMIMMRKTDGGGGT